MKDEVRVTFTLTGGTYESHRQLIYQLLLMAEELPRDDNIEILDYLVHKD